jgi:hypothetical protein
MAAKLENVGTIRLEKPYVFRQSFETASWYRDIEVPPGEYPIDLHLNPEKLPQFVTASLPGVSVGSLFINRVLWSSSAVKDEDLGQSFIYGLQTYPHSVAELASTGGEFRPNSGIKFALDPDKVRVASRAYETTDSAGLPVTREMAVMEFVRPVEDLLREQRDANRAPLTEPHELVHKHVFGSIDQFVVRVHAVGDSYKVVTTNSDHEPSARVISSQACLSLDEARDVAVEALGTQFTVRPQLRDYCLSKLEVALDAWAAVHGAGRPDPAF